jgi:hypothetical protein
MMLRCSVLFLLLLFCPGGLGCSGWKVERVKIVAPGGNAPVRIFVLFNEIDGATK